MNAPQEGNPPGQATVEHEELGLPWLVADVGGTNARFGWMADPKQGVEHVRQFAVADHAGPAHAAAAYLDALGRELGRTPPTPRRAALAVATAVDGDAVSFTNSQWSFSRGALRQAREEEKDDYTLAALDLAAGLSRDAEQYTAVHEASTKGQSPERRNYAMTAMSLYGDQAALDALGARVLAEADDVARLGGATALAVHGRAEDAPILVALLKRHRATGLQTQAAQVLGLHGTAAALDALLLASVDQKADRAVRAAAVQGLGLLLTRPPALAFADVSRQANYTVLPEWVRPLFYTTL